MITYFKFGFDIAAAAVGTRRSAKASYTSSIHLRGNRSNQSNKEKRTQTKEVNFQFNHEEL